MANATFGSHNRECAIGKGMKHPRQQFCFGRRCVDHLMTGGIDPQSLFLFRRTDEEYRAHTCILDVTGQAQPLIAIPELESPFAGGEKDELTISYQALGLNSSLRQELQFRLKRQKSAGHDFGHSVPPLRICRRAPLNPSDIATDETWGIGNILHGQSGRCQITRDRAAAGSEIEQVLHLAKTTDEGADSGNAHQRLVNQHLVDEFFQHR